MSNSSTFPSSIDIFEKKSEISASDRANLATYQSLLEIENLTSAQQTQLTQLTESLSQYLISSDNFNHVTDSVVNLENFFQSETTGYLDNIQQQWTDQLDQFTYVGAYSPSTTYNQWNVVTYNSQSYLSLKSSNLNQAPDTATTYWSLIAKQGATGPIGPAGAALSYVGTYNSLSTYQQNQLVSYNGSTYICLQNSTTGYDPTNTTYWTLFVTGATPLAQSTAPTNPVANQLWIDTSGTSPILKYWNESVWIAIGYARGVANGVASLDTTGQVPLSQLGNVPALPSDVAKTDVDNAFSVKQTFDAGASTTELAVSGLPGASTESRYVGAVSGSSPTTGTFEAGDWCIDITNLTFWFCTAAGSPGTWENLNYLRKDAGAGTQTVEDAVTFQSEVKILNPTELGTTAGDTLDLFDPSGLVTNGLHLKLRLRRVANGTDWQTSVIELVRVTDVSEQQSLTFNDDGQTISTDSNLSVAGSITASSGQLGSASGTWSPASGSLNVPYGTMITIAAVPSGAKMIIATDYGGNGTVSGKGSYYGGYFSGTGSGGFSIENGSVGAYEYRTSALQAPLHLIDGAYIAAGFYYVNGNYLQFGVESVIGAVDTAAGYGLSSVYWGVS